ncbi:hypothetical protein B0H17DRAFT_1222989 [Mycena rosella]|uniref:Uncharacterized protein n=1 Tax=Mycena rosella TaxID=1033263 RepID=A0AAD7F7B1_MYCRO|nr:hypothetical protein B0H17DRAFT_1222989 [Mycena rosella]
MRTLVYAGTRLLSGEAIDTIPGMEYDAAPFEAFTGSTTVTTVRGWFEPEQPSWLQRVVRPLMRVMWAPKEVVMQHDVTRIVRMPKVFLEESKREINNNLALQDYNEWVGSSDVLTAWWYKTLYGLRSSDDATPIHIASPQRADAFTGLLDVSSEGQMSETGGSKTCECATHIWGIKATKDVLFLNQHLDALAPGLRPLQDDARLPTHFHATLA